MTLTFNRPWSNIRTAHRLIILDICAELFENPSRGSKDIELTWKHDERTDRQQANNRAKNNVSPFYGGGDIITTVWQNVNCVFTLPHPGTSMPLIGRGISRDLTMPYLPHSSRTSSSMSEVNHTDFYLKWLTYILFKVLFQIEVR